MKKLLLVAAFVAASLLPARAQDAPTDAQMLTPLAAATVALTLCVMPTVDAGDLTDRDYAADVITILGYVGHGIDEAAMDAETKRVMKIAEGNKTGFCATQKPKLDRLVHDFRKKFSDILVAGRKHWKENN